MQSVTYEFAVISHKEKEFREHPAYLESVNNIVISTTDPKLIPTILASARSILPTIDIRKTNEGFGGEILGAEFHKLSGKDREFMYWLRAWLCHSGWEPIDNWKFRKLTE